MTTRELKNLFFNFFRSKGHAIIPSASLVPENDPSVLFTTAGMHPLVPYLMGEKHPQGTRLANVQKCIRTGDIDDVGDGVHLTFFEMLGNWSLGDYGKKEAIEWSHEFLTKVLKIPLERLAISVFAGDDDAPRDEESALLWKSLGMPAERIVYLGKDDNWWPAGANTLGPQGPDTEMFYWKDTNKPTPKKFDPKDSSWVEIWNDVFMEYERTADGKLIPLKQKNVDTGMGVERTCAVLSGADSVYEIDTIDPLMRKIRNSARKASGNDRSIRIIVDHMRAIVFLLADGVVPSNVDQGYVLRRLIRRSIRHAKMIGLTFDVLNDLAQNVIHEYHYDYPELARNREAALDELGLEIKKFSSTLEQGLRAFEKSFKAHEKKSGSRVSTQSTREVVMSGDEIFQLVTAYGFPLEEIEELAKERNLLLDLESYRAKFKAHQQKSRTAAAGKFKGGLADHSEETVKYHTANHLMLEAMKRVLGRDAVNQKGSNITAERLRFDFTFPRKLTAEEIKQIEELVNAEIAKHHDVRFEEMTVEDAKKIGATGVFEHKYGDRVKVYFVGDFSKEICGGPHVKNTAGMGRMKITKEEASSSGVRRIKAVLLSD